MSFQLMKAVVVFLLFFSSSVLAEDFVIETEIFVAGQNGVQASNLTIFQDDRVYDFSTLPDQSVTIFDPKSKRFTVADSKNRIQASLTVEELIRFVAATQTRAAGLDVELIRFAANPDFDVEFDESSGDLQLSSPLWIYRVQTMRASDSQLQRYNEFAKWFTQLNALFRPLPPNIRMRLNEELEKRGRLPIRVAVEIKKNGKVIVSQQSQHRLLTQLSLKQSNRLSQWQIERGSYQPIPFLEYQTKQLPIAQGRTDREKR